MVHWNRDVIFTSLHMYLEVEEGDTWRGWKKEFIIPPKTREIEV
jgi:hypothetical protein